MLERTLPLIFPVTTALVACAPSSRPVVTPHAEVAKPVSLYRLDFVVATTDAGGHEAKNAYSLNLEEHNQGEVRVGANVNLGAQSSGPRTDVGVMIRCRFVEQDGALRLHDETELSALDSDSRIRKVQIRGDVLLAAGKAARVASLDEPTSHTHTDVTVTATKLN